MTGGGNLCRACGSSGHFAHGCVLPPSPWLQSLRALREKAEDRRAKELQRLADLQRLETERVETERVETERLETERVETERLARERAESERAAADLRASAMARAATMFAAPPDAPTKPVEAAPVGAPPQLDARTHRPFRWDPARLEHVADARWSPSQHRYLGAELTYQGAPAPAAPDTPAEWRERGRAQASRAAFRPPPKYVANTAMKKCNGCNQWVRAVQWIERAKFSRDELDVFFAWQRERGRSDPERVPMCTNCTTDCVRCGENYHREHARTYGICRGCHHELAAPATAL